MNYLFFGPYWLFCVARAAMSGAFGQVEYGAFQGFEGLFLGFYGAMIWFAVAGLIGSILGDSQ